MACCAGIPDCDPFEEIMLDKAGFPTSVCGTYGFQLQTARIKPVRHPLSTLKMMNFFIEKIVIS